MMMLLMIIVIMKIKKGANVHDWPTLKPTLVTD